jgi:ADP-heptose:LPS heptosyltransferase
MGIGDDIMATAQARQIFNRTGKRVRFIKAKGVPYYSHADIWRGNPHIAAQGEEGDFELVVNAPGVRPYIEAVTPYAYTWKHWDKERGDIYLTREEERMAEQHADKVIISPIVKPKASPNKDWGWIRWAQFAKLARDEGIRLTQLGAYPTPVVFGVEWIETASFRSACAILSRARALVSIEGAMHHAAAALGVPAVVIFGGYIDPEITGYDGHINLFTGGKACGSRRRCRHCEKAMAAIAPAHVLESLKRFLKTDTGGDDGR